MKKEQRQKITAARRLRVLAFIKSKKTATIDEIATAVFARERPEARRNSWARNQLRDLVKLKLVEKVSSGTYQATA